MTPPALWPTARRGLTTAPARPQRMPNAGGHMAAHGHAGHAGGHMPREAHRPYRYGMTLLCFGGLLNWVGLFENYAEPVRYIGVACVVSGAILLCFAICCWLRPGAHRDAAWSTAAPHASATAASRDAVTFITLERASPALSTQTAQKPPDYESVTDKPPSYDDAIKLSPALLWLANEQERHGGQLLAGDLAKEDVEQMTTTVAGPDRGAGVGAGTGSAADSPQSPSPLPPPPPCSDVVNEAVPVVVPASDDTTSRTTTITSSTTTDSRCGTTAAKA